MWINKRYFVNVLCFMFLFSPMIPRTSGQTISDEKSGDLRGNLLHTLKIKVVDQNNSAIKQARVVVLGTGTGTLTDTGGNTLMYVSENTVTLRTTYIGCQSSNTHINLSDKDNKIIISLECDPRYPESPSSIKWGAPHTVPISLLLPVLGKFNSGND